MPEASGCDDPKGPMFGDRFAGQMEPGAMSLLHRIGVPFLSFCGRIRFGVHVHDFHSGLRGLTRSALEQMSFHTDSMEFATEFIAEAARKDLRIGQVGIPLRRPLVDRKAKLKTFSDGWRHLRYIVRG